MSANDGEATPFVEMVLLLYTSEVKMWNSGLDCREEEEESEGEDFFYGESLEHISP